MGDIAPNSGDVVRAQHIDLLRDALTAGALGVGNQFLGVPSAAPTVAVGAAGALTGTYHYAVTFAVVDINSSAIVGESLPSATSAAVVPAAQQVSLSAIPVSSNPRCNARNIYRTVAGGSQLKFVATINDNTTTTYTDNLADGSLGANIPTKDSSDGSVFSSQNWLFDRFFGPPN